MNQQIRICRVITRLNIGGPAQHTILLAAGLSEEGFETLLVAGREEEGEGSLLDLAKAKGLTPLLLPKLERPIRPAHDLSSVITLYRLFKGWRPHIVHTHTSKAGTLGRLAARVAGVPIIVHTFHGHIFEGYFPPWQAKAFLSIERLLARFTTKLVVLSEGQYKELLRLGIGREEQFAVLPLGLELDRFLQCRARSGELRQELGLSEEKLVGIVGRLVPIKGHVSFLEAAKRILEELPSSRFAIVGDGPLRKELGERAKALGLSDKVYFLGWRGDVERIYADLDLLVLSSLNEGTPVSVIEAMAAGLPIAATDVGGARDLITHGETGLLVKPDDPQALAEASLALLRDPERARMFGEAARRRAYPFYDVKTLLSRMEQFYRGLVTTSTRPLKSPQPPFTKGGEGGGCLTRGRGG